jgi:biopolymer transport protein ExbD
MSEISPAKNNCRVDLTPMVDLGFLLITFFVFTTSLQKPVALKLFLPNDQQPLTDLQIPANKTLSIVIDETNIGYYKGNNLHTLKLAENTVVDVRSAVINHMRQVQKNFGSTKEAVILLKPTLNCSYKQLVDCLDEMTINAVKKYMLLEATKEESARLLIKTQ